MAAHALVQGTLFHSPEQRTGKTSGKNFVAATLKVRDGEVAQFWRVLAFSAEAQDELLRLDDGDALSVQGGLRAEAYAKDGEPRVSLTVLADAGVPAYLRAATGDWPDFSFGSSRRAGAWSSSSSFFGTQKSGLPSTAYAQKIVSIFWRPMLELCYEPDHDTTN